MRAIDASAALEVLAKANEFGTVIPSNISPSPFIQIPTDNNNLNEETLDGKNATHAITMMVYQRKAFGPDLSPAPLVDHTTKRRSLQSTSSIYDIQECYAHGRRPAVSAYVNQVENKWFEDGKECFIDASRSDEVWSLMPLHPSRWLTRADTVVTFDLLIYMKAKQIQW